jgi:hypothetical protein
MKAIILQATDEKSWFISTCNGKPRLFISPEKFPIFAIDYSSVICYPIGVEEINKLL